MASMSALVSSNGRMFYIMDEGSRISVQLPSKWKLIARDAFNGTVLWKRDITEWQNHLWPLKSGPTQLTRELVSADKEIYTTLTSMLPWSHWMRRREKLCERMKDLIPPKSFTRMACCSLSFGRGKQSLRITLRQIGESVIRRK